MDADTYLKDNQEYLRVGRVLDLIPEPHLLEWKLDVGRAIANRTVKRAIAIGDEVDVAITASLRGEQVSTKKLRVESGQCLRGFVEWRQLNPIKPLRLQETVYDHQLMVAGTPDCVTETEIIDWKTTSQIKLRHVYQVLAYWWMLTHFEGLKIRQARIVRFDKILGTYEERVIPWQQDMYNGYESLAKFAVHWWKLSQLQQQPR